MVAQLQRHVGNATTTLALQRSDQQPAAARPLTAAEQATVLADLAVVDANYRQAGERSRPRPAGIGEVRRAIGRLVAAVRAGRATVTTQQSTVIHTGRSGLVFLPDYFQFQPSGRRVLAFTRHLTGGADVPVDQAAVKAAQARGTPRQSAARLHVDDNDCFALPLPGGRRTTKVPMMFDTGEVMRAQECTEGGIPFWDSEKLLKEALD